MASPAPSGLAGVKHIICVLSGKGGVGKSTVACQLAMALSSGADLFGEEERAARGGRPVKVGILDVDICGPSVPKICGAEGLPVTSTADGKWNPVAITHHQLEGAATGGPSPTADEEGDNAKSSEAVIAVEPLKLMSIAYLLPSATDAVVWRGPRKDAMIKQFLSDVQWGDLDYLIVDTPPGTSDEHMTLCEAIIGLNPTGAVVVTTPQDVSTDDVRKELSFCAKLGLRVLGIVENMSGFVCPHCAECTAIFSKGGGARLAAMYECPFLGEVPIDPAISLAEDEGRAFASALVEQDETRRRQQAEGGAAEAAKSVGLAAVVRNILAQVRRVEAIKQQQQQ